MVKKSFAVIALAILAVFVVPAAANAAGYVPDDNSTVSGDATAGGTSAVAFADGSFTGSEQVSFAVSGSGTATLTVVKAATATLAKAASAAGAVNVNVTLPAAATGSYNVTATGLTSGTVGTATITVVAADGLANTGDKLANTGDKLASTGYEAPVLLIWSAAGALLLGVALVIVLTIVRRKRANA